VAVDIQEQDHLTELLALITAEEVALVAIQIRPRAVQDIKVSLL
jgi:hypothetical protein